MGILLCGIVASVNKDQTDEEKLLFPSGEIRWQEVVLVSFNVTTFFPSRFKALENGYDLQGKVCHYGSLDPETVNSLRVPHTFDGDNEIWGYSYPRRSPDEGVYQTWMTLVAYVLVLDNSQDSPRVQLAKLLDDFESGNFETDWMDKPSP